MQIKRTYRTFSLGDLGLEKAVAQGGTPVWECNVLLSVKVTGTSPSAKVVARALRELADAGVPYKGPKVHISSDDLGTAARVLEDILTDLEE